MVSENTDEDIITLWSYTANYCQLIDLNKPDNMESFSEME